MAQQTEKIIIPLKFTGDTSDLQQQITALSSNLNSMSESGKIDNNVFTKLQKELLDLQKISSNTKLFDNETIARNVDSLNKSLTSVSSAGSQKINNMTESFNKMKKPIQEGETALDKFGRSLTNSLRYNLVNNFVDNLLSKGGDVIDFLEKVDENLNNIRIVSSKAQSEMYGFLQTSTESAKLLGNVTSDYLEASQIYYQQGLSTSEVNTRTVATVMSANVAGQSVSTTADQITAILNGFNVEANKTVEVLDKIAAVGARTATDFEEIAKASQKVSSTASVANLSIDQTLGILSTIASVTREAPESIGTSVNAIISRYNNLSASGDEYTSKIENAFKTTESGLTVFNEQTGLLKDFSVVLDELSGKWDVLDVNQQRTITSAIAGTRQANRLMALLNNWDMYEEYTSISADSEGALEAQNKIYLESLEAIKNQAQAAKESLYNELLDTDMLKDYYTFLKEILETITNIVDKTGGLQGVITPLIALLRAPAMKMIGPSLTRIAQNQIYGNRASVEDEVSAKQVSETYNKQFLEEEEKLSVNLLSIRERNLALSKTEQEKYQRSLDLLNEQYKTRVKIEGLQKTQASLNEVETSRLGEQLDTYETKESLMKLFDNYYSKESETLKARQSIDQEYYSKMLKETDGRTTLGRNYKSRLEESQRGYDVDFSGTYGNVSLELQEDLASIDTTIRLLKEKNKQASQSSIEENNKYIESLKEQKNAIRNLLVSLDEAGEVLIKDIDFSASSNELVSNISKIVQSNTELQNSFAKTLESKSGVKDAWKILSGEIQASSEQEAKIVADNALEIININKKQVSEQIKEQSKILNSNKARETSTISWINSLKSSASLATNISKLSSIAMAGAGAFQVYKVAIDDTLEGSEKMVGVVSGFGSALSAIPGPVGMVGMAIATLGPVILEVFGLGISQSEKLKNSINALKKSNDAFTKTVRQQSQDLATVNGLYKQLTDSYAEQKFVFSELNEEQQGQYLQVAEYLESYAPQLIKYYDTEGNAVIDLTSKYSDLTNSKKTYLELSLQENELNLYSQLTSQAGEGASLLVQNYNLAISKVTELKQKISSTKQLGLEGKDVEDTLTSLEEQLASYELTINSIASDWDELFTTVVTKGTKGYSDLDSAIQNSILSASSYSSFLRSDMDVTSIVFKQRIEELVMTLDSLSDTQKSLFAGFSVEGRDALFQFSTSIELSQNKLSDFFNLIKSEQDFLRGTFLSDIEQDVVDSTIQDYIKSSYINNQGLLSNQQINLADASFNISNLPVSEDYSNSISQQTDKLIEERTKLEEAYDSLTLTRKYGSEGQNIYKDIEELNLAISNNETIVENAATAQGRMLTEWADSIRDLANSGAESFNDLANSYNEMYESMKDSSIEDVFSNFGYSSAEAMTSAMGAMYAALNADNQDFYNDWVSINSQAISQNVSNLGVYAKDYKTYNEYMDAINAEVARNKVLFETLATKGAAEANEALLQYKVQTYTEDLAASGDKEALLQFIALDSAKQQEIAQNNLTISKLQAYGQELTGASLTEDGMLNVNKDMLDKMSIQNDEYYKGLQGYLDAAGVTDISLTGQGGKKVSTQTAKSITTSINDRINALKSANSEILGQASEIDKGKYQDLADALIGAAKLPEFKFNASLGAVKLKEIIPTTNINDNALTSGSSSSSSTKTIEDLEFDLDPLKKYLDKLEEIAHEIEILQQQREKLYGKDYLDNLAKEADLNRESLKVENEKLQKIKEISQEYRNQLSTVGVQFSDTGLILNYNEILQKQQDAVNILSGDAKEAAKENAEKLKEIMDKYEEYALDKKREAEKAVEDLKTELADLAREKIQYPIELIINASEKDLSYIDLIANIEKYQKGKINFSISADESVKNLLSSLTTIQDIFTQTSGVEGFLDSVLNNEDLAGNTQAQLELIEDQQEKMQKLAEELTNFATNFRESFSEGLEEAISILDEEVSKFDNIVSQYEYLLDLSDKLNITSIDQLNSTYSKMTSIYENNLKQTKAVANSIKESRDAFETGTEEWLIANEKYMDAQNKVMEQEKQLVELLNKRYDSTVSSGRKELESLLFGGSSLEETREQLDKMQTARSKYLDTERKIYELSKLERTISEDINSYAYDSKAQATLNKFMKEELSYLSAKEKLTQNDLDLASKQYDVVKARIELERAYNNETYTMMLQRNADGTFGYMYVQNTDSIKEAEQAYQDAIDQLYQYSITRTQELQKESIDIRSDALDEYDKIAAKLKAGTIDQEEAVKLLNSAFDEMNNKLKENAKEQAEMQKQVASSKLLQILGVTESELGGLNDLNQSLKKTFDLLGDNGEVSGLSGIISGLGLDSSEYIGSVGDQVLKLFKDLGGDKGAMDKLMKAFSETGNSTAATILSLLNQTGDLSSLTEQILEESLNGAGENFDVFLDKISSGTIGSEDLFTESLKNGLDSVEQTWDNLKDIIITDLDTFIGQFDTENPDSILSKVTNSILQAYEDYNKALEDSYNNLLDMEDELNKSTEEYNKNLENSVNKIKEEIELLTDVTKKYSNLRVEVLDAMKEITNYINLLNDARNNIENNSSNSTSSQNNSSSSSTSSSTNSSSNTSSSNSKTVGIGSRVKIIANKVYTNAYATTSTGVYADYLNSERTDLSVDGLVNGRYRVKQNNGGYIGWFDPNSLQAFHDGGKIDVNREGLALVKKNEAVLTEQEVNLVEKMKGLFKDLKAITTITNTLDRNTNNNPIEQNIKIEANFPNVSSAIEIEKAMENLYINSSQYINKK